MEPRTPWSHGAADPLNRPGKRSHERYKEAPADVCVNMTTSASQPGTHGPGYPWPDPYYNVGGCSSELAKSSAQAWAYSVAYSVGVASDACSAYVTLHVVAPSRGCVPRQLAPYARDTPDTRESQSHKVGLFPVRGDRFANWCSRVSGVSRRRLQAHDSLLNRGPRPSSRTFVQPRTCFPLTFWYPSGPLSLAPRSRRPLARSLSPLR